MGMGGRCENQGKDPVRGESWPLVLFMYGGSDRAEVVELAANVFSQGCGEVDGEGNRHVGITDGGMCMKTRGIWNKFRWKVDCIRVREKKILFQREQFLLLKRWGESSMSRWTILVI